MFYWGGELIPHFPFGAFFTEDAASNQIGKFREPTAFGRAKLKTTARGRGDCLP